jgi:acetyltransferase-like isoleucine patch superfamily enzyme
MHDHENRLAPLPARRLAQTAIINVAVNMTSFYSNEELSRLGLKNFGRNVLISRKCSIYGAAEISVGSNVRIDDFCVLSGQVNLGSHIHIGAYCGLFGSKGIVMGDFSGLSARVTIYSESDDYMGAGLTSPVIPSRFRVVKSSVVNIGRYALIGCGALILPGGNVSEGSVLGAMSLLKSTTDPWYIYAGVPAKKIKLREKGTILNLEKEYLHEANSQEC